MESHAATMNYRYQNSAPKEILYLFIVLWIYHDSAVCGVWVIEHLLLLVDIAGLVGEPRKAIVKKWKGRHLLNKENLDNAVSAYYYRFPGIPEKKCNLCIDMLRLRVYPDLICVKKVEQLTKSFRCCCMLGCFLCFCYYGEETPSDDKIEHCKRYKSNITHCTSIMIHRLQHHRPLSNCRQ